MGGKENWDVKPAQVYTTLARLRESGLVAEESVGKESGPEKRVYAITEAGTHDLNGWFAAAIVGEHLRDELFVKLMLSLATGDRLTRQVIRVQRAALYRELHDITTQRQAVDPQTGLAHILLLDKTVMHLEADLRWLDMVESRLEDVQRQSLPEPEARPRGRPPKRGR
jgi:DNA-binding PadR family transcriptional regulator